MTPFPGTTAPSAATARREGTIQSVEPTAEGEWRIVQQSGAEGEETRFAVYCGAVRVAWGVRDRAAAVRWLRRLRGASLPRLREATESVPAPRPLPERAWWLDQR